MAPVRAGYWVPSSGSQAENIDSNLFTHLFCHSADVDDQTYKVVIAGAYQSDFSSFTRKVQKKKRSIKTLLSIGGGAKNNRILAVMAKEARTRKSFIASSIQKASSNHFHGLNLHWDFPSTDRQMTDFGTLLREWREAICRDANDMDNEPLLLTALTNFKPSYEDHPYPACRIYENLDWINLRAYELYTPSGSPLIAGPHAALHNPKVALHSVAAGVKAWINKHVPAKKLVVGLAFHGFAWHLKSSHNKGVFASADGPAKGPGISGTGYITYKKVIEFIKHNNAEGDFDPETGTDYCCAGRLGLVTRTR